MANVTFYGKNIIIKRKMMDNVTFYGKNIIIKKKIKRGDQKKLKKYINKYIFNYKPKKILGITVLFILFLYFFF